MIFQHAQVAFRTPVSQRCTLLPLFHCVHLAHRKGPYVGVEPEIVPIHGRRVYT